MPRASNCVLLLLPAACSLTPQAATLNSRTASRATARTNMQFGETDESNAKTAERIAGKYAVNGWITTQDQDCFLKLNKIEATTEAALTKVGGAVGAAAVMGLQMDHTAASRALGEMVQHPPGALCFLLENQLCVVVSAAVGLVALSTCINATAAEELRTAADLVGFIANTDKFPTNEMAKIGKKLATTGQITDLEQQFRLGVKEAKATREEARILAGGAFLCSVVFNEMSSPPAKAVVAELAQKPFEALEFLTTENKMCVVGIVALSAVCVHAVNSNTERVVNQKGEDSGKIKALESQVEELAEEKYELFQELSTVSEELALTKELGKELSETQDAEEARRSAREAGDEAAKNKKGDVGK